MPASYMELWSAAGVPARLVLGMLAGMSIAAMAVAVGRWRTLRAAERASRVFLARWRLECPVDPETVAAEYPASPVATLIAVTTRAWETTANHEARGHVVERVAHRHLVAAGVELRRGLGVLATVGSTAPFVGLFGTVLGIIDAFAELDGPAGVAVVSGGLAEALVATALGIVVAIPAVWTFNHLSQRVARLLAVLECAVDELVVTRLQTTASAPPLVRHQQASSWR
jgi:biopolymer transport protein ExbB/TolQ